MASTMSCSSGSTCMSTSRCDPPKGPRVSDCSFGREVQVDDPFLEASRGKINRKLESARKAYGAMHAAPTSNGSPRMAEFEYTQNVAYEDLERRSWYQ